MPISKIQTNSLADTAVHGQRNLIINGACTISQRGTDFNDVANGTYTVDRYKLGKENTDEAVINIDQTTTAPDGFSNSLKISVGTAESTLAADELLVLQQLVEAQNLQHLQNGSSGAVSVTLSFWVRSSKTGTYTAAIRKPDNTDRNQSKEYTISSADTWEHKTLTFSGDTSGGGIANDNGAGFFIDWWLAGGSNFTGGTMDVWANTAAQRLSTNQVNLMDSTSNDWYITGVQLEVGEATPFEHRSFQDEITRCKRYYQKSFPYGTAPFNNAGQGGTRWDERTAVWPPNSYSSSTYTGAWCHLSVPLRVAPTTTQYNCNTLGTSGSYLNDIQNSSQSNSYAITLTTHNTEKLRFYSGGLSSYGNALGVNWEADAEL